MIDPGYGTRHGRMAYVTARDGNEIPARISVFPFSSSHGFGRCEVSTRSHGHSSDESPVPGTLLIIAILGCYAERSVSVDNSSTRSI